MKVYVVNYPDDFGLPKREDPYLVFETIEGYIMFVMPNNYIGLPRKIVENNPEIYTRLQIDHPEKLYKALQEINKFTPHRENKKLPPLKKAVKHFNRRIFEIKKFIRARAEELDFTGEKEDLFSVDIDHPDFAKFDKEDLENHNYDLGYMYALKEVNEYLYKIIESNKTTAQRKRKRRGVKRFKEKLKREGKDESL